ncbi:hypothetical protein CAEBREN_22146 [Caenorhabditis brenneri]|uniref:Uncharacterized protein n=1 Tax=Caenorhabditis brenneri TaxID=135651 RepID=G0MY75_CAEBE|nr:hypothetical protein CAEBREN_22146 [Caenorhabditis brenneri]
MEKGSIPPKVTKQDLSKLQESFKAGIAMWQMVNRDAQASKEADRIMMVMENYREQFFMPMYEKYRRDFPVEPEEKPIKIMRIVDKIEETKEEGADTNKNGESSSKKDKTNKESSSDNYVTTPYDKI